MMLILLERITFGVILGFLSVNGFEANKLLWLTITHGDRGDEWVALTTNDPAYTVSCNDVNQCHMMPFFCMGCSTKPIHYFPEEFSLLQQVSYFTFCLLASLFLLLLLNLDFFPTWSMMNFAGHWFHVQRSCQLVIFSPSTAEMRKENQKLPSYNISS